MESVCRRCECITKEKLYRVMTEDAGVVVLDILVCSSCARLAKALGLSTAELQSATTADVVAEDVLATESKRYPAQA
jgi:hypothetical protein